MKASAALLAASFWLALTALPATAGTPPRSPAPGGSTPAPDSPAPVSALRKINEIRFTGTPGWHMPLVFDERYAYLGTPAGLYRTTQWLVPERPFVPAGFAGSEIINLYLFRNELYVLKHGELTPSGPATDHSFLKSSDYGVSFVPLDDGLSECVGGYCDYLTATQASFKDDLILLTAGGGRNLFVSPNGGRSWSVLSGSVGSQACSYPTFELIGRRVLIGGECPLDFAYLQSGMLREDFLGWQESNPVFRPIAVEDLGNREVQFIRQQPNSATVFAGVEGGLLKSDDNGQSFRFVIKQPVSGSGKYPYITSIVFPSMHGNIIIASGFDKAGARGYLAYSHDGGETWVDISELVLGSDFFAYDVPFITEDPQGRVIAVVLKRTGSSAWSAMTAEVNFNEPPPPPTLLTEEGTAQAIALESVNFMGGAFPLINRHNFSHDQRTRIMLLARNLNLLPGEDASAVTAQAEDADHKVYVFPVEYAGPVPNFEWLQQVVVRIPDALSDAGQVQVSISCHGMTSNKAVLSITSSDAASP